MLRHRLVKNSAVLFFFLLGIQSTLYAEDQEENSPLVTEQILAQTGEIPSESENIPLAKKYFLEGKTFFDAGYYQNALEAFRKSLYEDPTDPILNHLMGRSAFELGEFEEALFAFERVLVLNPNLALSRLEKARTHLALGSKLEAKEELERVLEADLPDSVRSNVEGLLASIGAERKHEVSSILLVSNMWDSNSTLGTGPLPFPTAPSLISSPTQRSDRVLSIAGVLSHRYPLATQGMTLKNSLTGFLSDNTTVNTNDILLANLSSGFEYSRQRHLFSANATWTGIVLDEHLYQNNVGVALNYAYAYSQRLNLRSGWGYTRRHHFSRVGANPTFGFVHSYNFGASFLQNAKNNWDFSWTHKFDKTPVEGTFASGYNRYELAGRFTRILTSRLNLNLSGVRRHDEYTSPSALSPSGAQRSDIALIGSAGLTFKLTPKILLDCSTSYSDNESNIPNNTYIVKQLIFTLTALF